MHRMRRRRGFALLLAALVLLPGCGRYGQYSGVDFQASVKALQSIAAEGSLIASNAARSRTLTTFVRTHGQELSDQTEHEAEKMSDAPLAPGFGHRVSVAISLASKIGSAIDDLRVNPHDRKAAASTARDLRSYANQVQRLGGSS
jgi:hypothetical protein